CENSHHSSSKTASQDPPSSSAWSSTGICNGSRQLRADTCPACTQAIRVTSDPASAEILAQRRSALECLFPPNKLVARSTKATGPESTPPARVIHPLGPCFSGSKCECPRPSMRNPSQHSNSAAPRPSACKARLLSLHIISSKPTAAPKHDTAK